MKHSFIQASARFAAVLTPIQSYAFASLLPSAHAFDHFPNKYRN